MDGHIAAISNGIQLEETQQKLKEQFIHGLNDIDMLAEIIREFTKIQEKLLKMCFAGLKE